MSYRRKLVAMLLIALVPVLTVPAFSVQPDEVLSDPALEARARALSSHLRCMVCQNQSIDDSNAALAKDVRVLVRERLSAGDTDEQVMSYVVSRYGEFVLLKPQVNWRNAALWGTPLVLLVVGGLFVFTRRRSESRTVSLTNEEQETLRKILGDRSE